LRLPVAGYTLMEVLVALGLTAIVTAGALPGVARIANEYRLMEATHRLGTDIYAARMEAVGRNLFVRIRFESESSYRVESSSDGVVFQADGFPVELPSGITAVAQEDAAFDPRGLAAGSSTVVLSNGRTTTTVRTSPIGRVTIS
jgi:Tfp pilus assembly protein FimT